MKKNLTLLIFFLFFLLFTLFVSKPCYAGVAELNLFYLSDTLTMSTNTQSTKTTYDLGVGFDFGKKGNYLFEVVFGSFQASDNNGTTTTTYTVADQGFKFGSNWGNSKAFYTGLTYNIISKAKYNDGSSEVELRGTSMKVDFGYNIWFAEGSALMVKLAYYIPTFTEQISGTTLTPISYNRTTINPAIGFMTIF